MLKAYLSMNLKGLKLIWSLQVVHTVKAHEKNVRAMGYDPNASILVTGSFDRKCQTWEESPSKASK